MNKSIWSIGKLIEETKKFKTKKEWLKNSKSSYVFAQKNGLIASVSSHMKRPIKITKWTKETTLEESKKYSNRKEWKNNSSGSYNKALEKGWMQEATAHMSRPPVHNKKWTKETTLEESKKYSNRKEWQNNSKGSYLAAHRNGWMQEATVHMKSHKSMCESEKEILSIVKEIYPSARSIRIQNNYKEFSFKRLEIDIYVPELKKGIEFDGTYWHKPEILRKNRPNWKNEEIENYEKTKDIFFAKHGISILHVHENTWKKSKMNCLKAILTFIGVSQCQD